jgi:hypothetical protein
MLRSGPTRPLTVNQPPKTKICGDCGCSFEHRSRTLPPSKCVDCKLQRRRALDRVLAEKKRRAQGISPVKSTLAYCVKCDASFVRTNVKHTHCSVCGEINYRSRTRAASKERYASEVGRAAAHEYQRKRYREDPAWRVSAHMRVLMHRALRSRKQGRSWRDLVPYSLSELMAHLERQFLPGMTWENCGRWHIDHKIPRKFFQAQSADDPAFQQVWALSNLQPLWAIDNIRKSAKLTHLPPLSEDEMIKMKALRSANMGENSSKVRRGREFGVATEQRANELEVHGLAYRIQTKSFEPPAAVVVPPQNRAAESGPLGSPGGTTGADELALSSPQGRPQRRRTSRRSAVDSTS